MTDIEQGHLNSGSTFRGWLGLCFGVGRALPGEEEGEMWDECRSNEKTGHLLLGKGIEILNNEIHLQWPAEQNKHSFTQLSLEQGGGSKVTFLGMPWDSGN